MPTRREPFLLSLDLPDDVCPEDFAAIVHDAIRLKIGTLHRLDPMTRIDLQRVRVRPKSEVNWEMARRAFFDWIQ